MLVFVPLAAPAFLHLAAGRAQGPVAAWRAVPANPGPGPGDADEAEWAEHEAMVRASFDGLARFGLRLVMAVDLPQAAWPGDDPATPGRGSLERLEPRHVTAFFTDDVADLAAVQAVGRALAGRAGERAWSEPEAEGLADCALMWFDATELGRPLVVATVDGPATLDG